MNGILNTLIFAIFFIFVFNFIIKMFLQKREMDHASILLYAFSIGIGVFSVAQGCLIFDLAPYHKSVFILKVSLGFIAFSSY